MPNNQWLDKCTEVHLHKEYYSEIKNKLLIHARWRNLKAILLSKTSKIKKEYTYGMILFT